MNTKEFLGKEVVVTMDRPLGSLHPKYGYAYPVNYGMIKGVISGDGEDLDAYVLGEDKPLKTFKGEVKAIIHRTNDDDDKLIVASHEKNFSDEEIREATNFQEQYFESEIWRENLEKE